MGSAPLQFIGGAADAVQDTFKAAMQTLIGGQVAGNIASEMGPSYDAFKDQTYESIQNIRNHQGEANTGMTDWKQKYDQGGGVEGAIRSGYADAQGLIGKSKAEEMGMVSDWTGQQMSGVSADHSTALAEQRLRMSGENVPAHIREQMNRTATGKSRQELSRYHQELAGQAMDKKLAVANKWNTLSAQFKQMETQDVGQGRALDAEITKAFWGDYEARNMNSEIGISNLTTAMMTTYAQGAGMLAQLAMGAAGALPGGMTTEYVTGPLVDRMNYVKASHQGQ